MSERQLPIILALGTTQTLAWASSYYLPAILADPIARELGISNNWFFAAFSASLVISGLLGPRVGRQIDIVGGRQVLSISNVTLAFGLALLGSAHSILILTVAWLILGIGMGMGLYDAAFGALGRIYGDRARRAITGITLLAGEHRRLAAYRLGPGDDWMAKHMFCLGCGPHHYWSAAESIFHPTGRRGQGQGSRRAQASYRHRPHDGFAGVRLRGGVGGDGNYGRAFAAHT